MWWALPLGGQGQTQLNPECCSVGLAGWGGVPRAGTMVCSPILYCIHFLGVGMRRAWVLVGGHGHSEWGMGSWGGVGVGHGHWRWGVGEGKDMGMGTRTLGAGHGH